MSLISSWQWWLQKKPHSQEGEVTAGLQSNGFLEEVISKVVVDPPATTSLRWSSVYRILQRKYTWCRVKFESTLHETELCKDVIKMLLLIAFSGRLFSFQKWWQVFKVWISIETILYYLPHPIFHHGSLFWETARQGCRRIRKRWCWARCPPDWPFAAWFEGLLSQFFDKTDKRSIKRCKRTARHPRR